MDPNALKIDPIDIWGNFTKLFRNTTSIDATQIFRWAAVIALGFYVLFALTIVRQVGLMTRFLGTALSPWLKTFAWGYVIYTVIVLLFILGVL